MQSPSLPVSQAQWSSATAATPEFFALASLDLLNPIVALSSLQIFWVNPNQFSRAGAARDRTRCLIKTNDFESQALTNIQSWLVPAHVSYAIA
jgi:hypothetical protein